MDDATPRSLSEPSTGDDELEDTLKIWAIAPSRRTGVLDKPVERPLLPATASSIAEAQQASSTGTADISDEQQDVARPPMPNNEPVPPGTPPGGTLTDTEKDQIAAITTLKLLAAPAATVTDKADMAPVQETFAGKGKAKSASAPPRWQALLFIALLSILVFQTANLSFSQFIGQQGWSFVLYGPGNASDANLIKEINQQLHKTVQPTPGTTSTPTRITPQQYINLIMQRMTLNQKLGQLMLVQFVGPSYSPDLSTMISQYDVGAVLIFASNNNIESKPQLKGLIQQMQNNSSIPLIVSIDQEGGTVDRLANLDGKRPSAAAIGATNDPQRAWEEGVQDAKDLSYYGINLNLAPVVDVTNVFSQQLYLRTFGNNPTIVTKMASAYLRGLQQSKKVMGTLKHFPGLGDVVSDPHITVPYLNRSASQLEAIDWAPYRALIAQGNVYSIMVTHEIVQAIDSSKPSSLSYKLVTGILRDKLGFHGVIVTDSLTMEGITAYYTEAQAAVMAIEAGDDLLMGASTPADVAAMVEGLKQAVASGEISQQRIDDSVRRILMLKYQMGLLPLPTS